MSGFSATSSNQSALQKHVAFFDRNKDGVIYPWETFQGCRAIGLGIGLSTLAAVLINMGLSRKTRPGMLKANRIHKDYHGWIGSWVEWKIFFYVCKDKNGLLQKETIRACYTGDLFEQMEQERACEKKRN
ncbi:probable peroxygenase 4 isoform X2 [Papaver somniferum]|uniref:probable peroxygenase 4 isoform X2 n=1 Tax=Papaver somniferum TaxID=3469 RepID=UPI000E701FC5|nr:probable peroxygenase 4 isoform X2 [Papaver somniferum]